MKKKYLVLADGSVYEGVSVGADHESVGELVFTTGMEGYLETLTDPSYYGQIVTQTFPLIGNYGVIEEDFEGRSELFGYIVRELCDTPSNFRSAYPLNDYLVAKGIPGLCGVDTREIVRITREEGVMNAMICDEVPRIHAAQAGNALRHQVIVQRIGAAEVGGRVAQFPDDIAEERTVAFKVLLNHAVVADQGEGLGDDLAVIARIGQGFQVAFHAGGEDQFADPVDRGTDPGAFKGDAVAQNQVRHGYSSGIEVDRSQG